MDGMMIASNNVTITVSKGLFDANDASVEIMMQSGYDTTVLIASRVLVLLAPPVCCPSFI